MPRTKQCRRTRANGSTSAKVATPSCVRNRVIVVCSARSVRCRALQSKPVVTTLAAVPKRRGSPTQQPSTTDQCGMPGRLQSTCGCTCSSAAQGGIRRYDQNDLSRLHFIKTAKRLGFSLDETAQLLQLDDGASCAQARTHAESKLAEVQLKLADLHRMEAVLSELIDLCSSGRGKVRCPLIAAMERQSPPLQI